MSGERFYFPSGTVGFKNNNGAWVFTVPAPGYVYAGANGVLFENSGDGNYNLSMSGSAATRHTYASWLNTQTRLWEHYYVDVNGNPTSLESATYVGEPSSWVWEPGYIVGQLGVGMVPGPNPVPVHLQNAPPHPNAPAILDPGEYMPQPVGARPESAPPVAIPNVPNVNPIPLPAAAPPNPLTPINDDPTAPRSYEPFGTNAPVGSGGAAAAAPVAVDNSKMLLYGALGLLALALLNNSNSKE